ncbi:MAG: ATP-grasp domain-containing protein [Myxococcota bacterium]|nr:ATP-grasp domain-containing protein [Myxococcota bacterium]
MTVDAPPSQSSPQEAPDRRPPPRRARANKRIAVLYNVDYEDHCPEVDPGWAARAEVRQVAAGVAAALDAAGCDTHLISVDGDLASLRASLAEIEPDCAFNLCESLAGDARLESAVPVVLELLGIPFTGSPPEVLSFALRKDRVKRRLEAAGIPTPPGRVLTGAGEVCDLPFPLIVKPVREDGSVGISRTSVVRSPSELARAVEAVVTSLRQPCLVEQFIDGREFNVAMLGHPTPRVLPLSEIVFDGLPVGAPHIVSYEAKWSGGSVDDLGTVPVLHPALPNSVAARVRRAAAEAFRAVGVRDYGRVDVRLAATGIPYVIDVNPNCDLSPNAGISHAAAAVGIDYGSFVRLLVRYALRRRRASSTTEKPAAVRSGSERPL